MGNHQDRRGVDVSPADKRTRARSSQTGAPRTDETDVTSGGDRARAVGRLGTSDQRTRAAPHSSRRTGQESVSGKEGVQAQVPCVIQVQVSWYPWYPEVAASSSGSTS